MKTCSKCKVEQDETEFVKSPRYKDGLYPSCKTCRKETKTKALAANPLCSKCKEKPHVETHPYCYDCMRVSSGQPPVARYRRDNKNKKCSHCKVAERLEYSTYCAECKRTTDNARIKKNGGWWQYITPEQRKKCVVRKFIHNRVKAGTFERKPCEVCGGPSEFHHLDYEPRTLNVRHLCKEHHKQAEDEKRLTEQKTCTTNELSGAGLNQLDASSSGGQTSPES